LAIFTDSISPSRFENVLAAHTRGLDLGEHTESFGDIHFRLINIPHMVSCEKLSLSSLLVVENRFKNSG
jgi:hypothetical protein